MSKQPAENQLNNFKNSQGGPAVCTNPNGSPIGTKAALTVGERGPILLQDVNLIEELSHFTRERIPERVVHAKGGGAFGYFEVTHDITKYTGAKLFEKVGKRTPVGVRFSTVGAESGSADTVRDPRGFAVKFYTDDGNWDLVGNNTPIFFIKDPMLFPSFIHTQKRNPATHLKDPDMFWDFITLRPETTHQTMLTFADRGIPDGFRFMNGYGSHTYKFVNSKGEPIYVKFHFKVEQGIKNLNPKRAEELSATDPDYSIRDLYNAIARGEFPQWNLKVQVMTFAQAETFQWNPFDMTKIWPQKEYPLIPVGKMVLDRNPTNYFTEVEQIAFSPSHLVPGIEPSPDRMLQGRLFAYGDTQRHRIGANYQQIPVNCPYKVSVNNYHKDGPMNTTDNQKGCPNYFPNSFSGPATCEYAMKLQPAFNLSGDVTRTDTGMIEDNFSQPANFWNKILDVSARKRMVENIAEHLVNASLFIQERAVKNFGQVHVDFGIQLAEALKLRRSSRL